ncbi:hypothetical protein D0S48_18235 [Psychrobacillus sp. AK 1817]|uniref:ankyrin repeat domain-containing protein n=1 Tax=Psychrobacillus sp. AK 1817 TaxID=2303505 RepID=UPI00124729B4|nr:ankyrin repeat domain-containing protein [Psychrobacillus sp. AK 1817]QEY22439.1 hypothetical protein D0S48_18235 [Psychrobacillus sp. AK 1817]
MSYITNEEFIKLVTENSNIERIGIALENGVNPNINNRNVKPPIIIAVQNKSIEVIKLLLENGAEINVQDAVGKTALFWASGRKNYDDIVKLLVENGANPTISDKTRTTPLQIAVRKGEKNYVDLMLSTIVPFLSQEGYELIESIEIASRKGYVEILLALLTMTKSLKTDYDFINSALKEASQQGQLNIVKTILESERVYQYIGQFTPLMLSSSRGHLEIMKMLMDAGFDPNLKGFKEQTALMEASLSGKVEAMNLLIQRNADINLRDRDGKTALIMSIEEGHVDVVVGLLENGANPYLCSKDKYGNSLNALMWAAYKKNEEIMNVLLDVGVNPNLKNEIGESAIFLAIEDNRWHTTITDILDKEYDLDGSYRRIVQMFINKGLDVNIKDREGNTLTIWATLKNYKKVLELLLLNGAEVILKNNKGKTALDYSRERYNCDSIIRLLEKYS